MAQAEPETSEDVSDLSSLHGDEPGSRNRLEQTTQPYGEGDHLHLHLHLQPPLATQQQATPDSSTPLTGDNGEEKPQSDSELARPLELHPIGLLLILLYAFAAIVSWTVTCILSFRPIGYLSETGDSLSYYDQTGMISRWSYTHSDRWRRAASIGLTIVSAVGIPLTSAICAGATPVYCQRKSSAKKPSLTMRQPLALADKGWSDIAIRNLIRPSTSRQTGSGLLIFSMGLVSLALDEVLTFSPKTFVIPVLQSALVKSVHLQVSSMEDELQQLGTSMSMGELPQLDSTKIIPSVASAIVDTTLQDKQPFMWVQGVGNVNLTDPADEPDYPDGLGNLANEFFISDFPVGTDTGMLRALVYRFNSSVDCKIVPSSSFPSTCPGNNPLNTTYSNVDKTESEPFGDLRDPKFEARLCAPGDIYASPWNRTGARQDIDEEFYLDFRVTKLNDLFENLTLKCISETSLGFFELPNYWNGHIPGPLLSTLPPQKAPNQTYTDGGYPQNFTEGPFLDDITVPGPFLTAILATFSNNSFFDITASHENYPYSNKLVCNQLRQPFVNNLQISATDEYIWRSTLSNGSNQESGSSSICEGLPKNPSNSSLLLYALLNWLPNFIDIEAANAAFLLATYSASAAMMNPNNSPLNNNVSTIFSSSGFNIQKPAISIPAVIIIRVLLAIQLTRLTWLAILGSWWATWTPSLNAFALLRMGAALHKDLPPMSTMKATELAILDEKPGWVGGDGRGERIQKLEIGGPAEVGGSNEFHLERKYLMVENESDWTGDEKRIGGWKKLFSGGYTDERSRHHQCSFRRVRRGASEDEGEA